MLTSHQAPALVYCEACDERVKPATELVPDYYNPDRCHRIPVCPLCGHEL